MEMSKNLKFNFLNECMVIKLKIEYKGYTGVEEYAIATKLNEKELICKYGDILNDYKPYILISDELTNVITDYRRNEETYWKRYLRKHDMYDVTDSDFTNYHPECASHSAEEEYLLSNDLKKLKIAFQTLTEKEKRRIDMYYFDDLSLREIAEIEGVNHHAVHKTILSGLKKIKSFMK